MQERRVHFASLNARKYATGLVVIQCSISEDDYGLAPQLLAATGQLRNAGWAGPVRDSEEWTGLNGREWTVLENYQVLLYFVGDDVYIFRYIQSGSFP